MRQKLRVIGTLALVSCLSACGLITPKPEDIRVANFGPRPSHEEAVTLVKVYMSKTFFDPYSAVFECHEPRKAWANFVGTLYYGYAVTCDINAKNRYGGYVGSQPYNFIINSGAVILDGWARVGYLD